MLGIKRRFISRNPFLVWLWVLARRTLGGLQHYKNDYYQLTMERSSGLITKLYINNMTNNLAFSPLGFPLNEYFDAARKNYYWPSYTINRTKFRIERIWHILETEGHTRDYFLRKGVLKFNQKLFLSQTEPYFVVETHRTFEESVNRCLDESLCFIFESHVAGKIRLINDGRMTEEFIENGSLTLTNPPGEVLALYEAGPFGLIIYVENCQPTPELVRWALPHMGERFHYCEFEVVWIDQEMRRSPGDEFIRCSVLPYDSRFLSDILNQRDFLSDISPQVAFENLVNIYRLNFNRTIAS